MANPLINLSGLGQALFDGFRSGDLIKAATGRDADENRAVGDQVYADDLTPEERARNQGAHRLAARGFTNRFGIVPAQVGGIANELIERARVGKFQGDELGDLSANIKGSADALGDQYPGLKLLMGFLDR